MSKSNQISDFEPTPRFQYSGNVHPLVRYENKWEPPEYEEYGVRPVPPVAGPVPVLRIDRWGLIEARREIAEVYGENHPSLNPSNWSDLRTHN